MMFALLYGFDELRGDIRNPERPPSSASHEIAPVSSSDGTCTRSGGHRIPATRGSPAALSTPSACVRQTESWRRSDKKAARSGLTCMVSWWKDHKMTHASRFGSLDMKRHVNVQTQGAAPRKQLPCRVRRPQADAPQVRALARAACLPQHMNTKHGLRDCSHNYGPSPCPTPGRGQASKRQCKLMKASLAIQAGWLGRLLS